MPAVKTGGQQLALLLLVGSIVTAGLVAVAVQSTLLGAGIIGLFLLLFAAYRRPRIALVIWLLTFAFVPTWIGVDVGTFLPAITVIGVLVLLTNLGSTGWHLSRADLVIVVMILVGFLATTFYTSSFPSWVAMITQWLLCYLAAKTVIANTGVQFAGRALVAVLAVVAVLALIEFVFHWHPYVNLGPDNGLHETWGPIQERGGVDRSEWSFGHSIALSGALSMAIPFVLGSDMHGGKKAVLTVLLAAGTAATFSRAGLGAVALGIFLSLLFQANLRAKQKVALSALLAVAAAFALPLIGRVFDNAGNEATWSSAYRGRLLDLIPTMQPIGRASVAVVGGDGSVTFGGFQSIDSTFLQLGLGFGWLIALTALIPFVVLLIRILIRRGSTADLALFAQLPLIATVAMITQWQSLVWVLAGMAVVAARERRKDPLELPNEPEGARCRKSQRRADQLTFNLAPAAGAARNEAVT